MKKRGFKASGMIRSLNNKTPRIAESAFISESAYIVGDVEIGDDSNVWPGVVIRGDFGSIKIGRGNDHRIWCKPIVPHSKHFLSIG